VDIIVGIPSYNEAEAIAFPVQMADLGLRKYFHKKKSVIIFIAAVELKAQAVVVVDADLKSITPEWIQYLGEPLFSRFNYVCPISVRHKYDGSITNPIGSRILPNILAPCSPRSFRVFST